MAIWDPRLDDEDIADETLVDDTREHWYDKMVD